MTQWAQSLIRISRFEVEGLQKRLAEVAARRASAEMRLACLDAEREVETERARSDGEAALLLNAFLDGWTVRRAAAEHALGEVTAEEQGARDALTSAFEELKKFEHVSELTRLAELAERAKRETAAFDEIALRRRAAG
ncbi:flagellar FliJ family protein [Brevundimonas sp. 2R-24]|uniref:Flagellar FliJ protein n=1 Tax=Peiella sedimenti TaxID=3061083 RepID=A0ABT8SHM3_9CAUL|nr:flagellar FliJ family protein [Caulobacteraceae bacterium XZ-24]